MPPRILVLTGAGLVLLAVALSWATAHWVDSRTFKPVDTPVLLEAGRAQTIRFTSNLRENYFIETMVDYSADDWAEGKCNSKMLRDMTWKMYRLRGSTGAERELWASRDGAQYEWYLWRIIPGEYELEWTVPAGATCLNARHPQLKIATDSSSYEQAVNVVQYGAVFVGGSGLMLIVLAAKSQFATVFRAKSLRIFPEMELRNVLPLQRHAPMALFSAPLDFGIAWGSVLMVVAFVFYRYLLMTPPQHGLWIQFSNAALAAKQENPWNQTLAVYIDGKGRFHVNGEVVNREALRAKLSDELGKRMVWIVYLEADNDTIFDDTVYSIDTIQGLGAKVIWITPRMREEWKREAAQTSNPVVTLHDGKAAGTRR